MEQFLNIPSISVLGCKVHRLTMTDTISLIDDSIKKKKFIQHTVVNAAKIVNMHSDNHLHQAILSSDIVNADGQAVVWASKILNRPLPERVAGIDLMINLIALAHEKKYRIFFFGASETVVKKVVDKYSQLYSTEIIAGYRNGYYLLEQEPEIAKSIADSKADILFVAMTSPKKEIFLNTYKDIIRTPFIMGVGGSFDVVSGMTKRAPIWMQKSGLEWFFRVLQEPRRMWKRYLVTNLKFIGMVIRYKLGTSN